MDKYWKTRCQTEENASGYYKQNICFSEVVSFICTSSQAVKMQIEADNLTESKERVCQGLKSKIPYKIS